MALNGNALIDSTYFDIMWQGDTVDSDRLDNIINAVSTSFERFCNRPLKQRSFTYDEDEEDTSNGIYYMPDWTVFDAPPKAILWMPTYPIETISYLEISGNEVSVCTDYEAVDGYRLYNLSGKVVYTYGYDYPYQQNVKIKWKGGYTATSPEMSHLQYLAFSVVRDTLNSPQNATLESEKIGQYSYKTISTYFLKELQGLSPKVYSDLSKYRREAIG